MPFDSNGTFNRVIPGGWKADALAGIKIRADRHDNEDDGFATGLSTCITKDGRTQPTANLPMNNKKLINLGDPTNPQDGATKNYVDNFKTFTTGATINGAGPINGFLNFASPVGVNGIGWTTADMSWVGKLNEADKYIKRLAINDAKDGTGTDLVWFDETGRFYTNSGQILVNLTYDGAAWRTPVAGKSTWLQLNAGTLNLGSNDAVTTAAFSTMSLRTFFSVQNQDGNAHMFLDKSASGKSCWIMARTGTSARWLTYMGDSSAESSTRTGSNYYIYSYDNAGANAYQELYINRASHAWDVGGSLTANGLITNQNIASNTATLLLAASGGTIYLRPGGYSYSPTGVAITSAGHLMIGEGNVGGGGLYACLGLQGRSGTAGGYDGIWHNLYYSGGFEYVYVNSTLMGAITWQSDRRIKKAIKPMPSMWENVKKLNPVTYKHKKYREFVKDEDVERWGLVADEVQQALTPTAAIGNKDEENVIQSLNPLTLIAALTKALQEAMERIEKLEGAKA